MNLIAVLLPYFVGFIVLFALSRIVLAEADSNRPAEQLPDGRLIFAPEKMALVAMVLFVGGLGGLGIFGSVVALFNGHGLLPSLFCLAFAALLLCILPGTLTLTNEGLEQRYWAGNVKRIRWRDVTSVRIVQKEGRVVISGLGYSRIQHTRQLPDRDRLMAELQAHCPDRMPGAAKNASSQHRQWVVPPPPPPQS